MASQSPCLPHHRTFPVRTWSQPEDQDHRTLVARAKAGDPEAFSALYAMYSAPVRNLCARMLKNDADAEDLAQKIFLSVFEKISLFREESRFATWLFRITQNHALMALRNANRFIPLDDFMEPNGQGLTQDFPAPDTDEALIMTPERLAIFEALNLLSPKRRIVFELSCFEGYTHKEIAQMTGCSVPALKSRLYKARLQMAEYLKKRRTVPQAARHWN